MSEIGLAYFQVLIPKYKQYFWDIERVIIFVKIGYVDMKSVILVLNLNINQKI